MVCMDCKAREGLSVHFCRGLQSHKDTVLCTWFIHIAFVCCCSSWAVTFFLEWKKVKIRKKRDNVILIKIWYSWILNAFFLFFFNASSRTQTQKILEGRNRFISPIHSFEWSISLTFLCPLCTLTLFFDIWVLWGVELARLVDSP